MRPCRLSGSGLPASCGTLRVFEDRARKLGRTLELHVAVVPALAAKAEPEPLFLLAGGPGQGAIDALSPALGAFAEVHRRRDLVLVDLRGTGASHPLTCELVPKERAAELVEESAALYQERLGDCARKLDADPRLYTTRASMDDLDEVREALGYARIDLWGGSYGTRAALVYLRDHGEHARAAVLDGVAPYALHLPANFAPDAQRSLELIFSRCAKEPACAKAYPKLRERFDALLSSLSAAPLHNRVTDPLTGMPREVRVSRELFVRGLRGILYAPELVSLVPLTLDRSAEGDLGSFFAQASLFEDGQRQMSLGLLASILCNEDLPNLAPGEVERAAAGTFLGPRQAQDMLSVCAVWPHRAVPLAERTTIRSEAPVLLLSGELDPVTPPSWAQLALATLPRGRALTVPGVGHGASSRGCLPSLVARFLDTADAQGLDTSCVERMKPPPFFTSFAGPPP